MQCFEGGVRVEISQSGRRSHRQFSIRLQARIYATVYRGSTLGSQVSKDFGIADPLLAQDFTEK